MRTEIKYIAFDGTEFDSEDDCRFYEGRIGRATPELKLRIMHGDLPIEISGITLSIEEIAKGHYDRMFVRFSVKFTDEKGDPIIELPTQGRRLYVGDTITVANLEKLTELKIVAS